MWKDIPGYEGIYEVSNLGMVKSLSRLVVCKKYRKTKEKILKFGKTKRIQYGKVCEIYLYVNLHKIGVKTYRVNRLVASAFHGLDLNDPEQLACHKDDDTMNNREDNIFVGTHKDNMEDMHKKGRHVRSVKKIFQYSLEGILIKEWGSRIDASIELGIHKTNISHCCRGKKGCKTAGGFIWKYK